MKTVAECLADEIINTEKKDAQKSYAIKKKEEIEKVAKGNRWVYLTHYLTYIPVISIESILHNINTHTINL